MVRVSPAPNQVFSPPSPSGPTALIAAVSLRSHGADCAVLPLPAVPPMANRPQSPMRTKHGPSSPTEWPESPRVAVQMRLPPFLRLLSLRTVQPLTALGIAYGLADWIVAGCFGLYFAMAPEVISRAIQSEDSPHLVHGVWCICLGLYFVMAPEVIPWAVTMVDHRGGSPCAA